MNFSRDSFYSDQQPITQIDMVTPSEVYVVTVNKIHRHIHTLALKFCSWMPKTDPRHNAPMEMLAEHQKITALLEDRWKLFSTAVMVSAR